MKCVKSICDNFDSTSDNVKEDLLLYSDSRFDDNKNKVILKTTINYTIKSKNFYQKDLRRTREPEPFRKIFKPFQKH